MKRSDFYIRLTTAVLFLAVVCYIGVYVYNALVNTYVTTQALSYTIERTFRAQGYIVRTETALADAGATVLPIVNEGEKVASGQAIAVEYLSREALETASEIRSLRLIIAQLESSGGAAAAEATSLESVMELSKAVHRNDFSKLDELSLKIETNVFAGGFASGADLPALKKQLAVLEGRSAGLRTIYAPVSGTFSHTVDGFEHIQPEALDGIMPGRLAELFGAPARVSGAGKLVTEFKWYFAAVMDAAEASGLPEGQTVTVHFSGVYNAAMELLVERVGRQDEGKCVALFSSDRGIHEIAPLRGMRADVISGAVSGIRVPREAIHLDDDGTTYIFLQTGVTAERVDVEILLEAGDSYLVRDGTETGTPLRAGATIIVKANNLFDGKVVA